MVLVELGYLSIHSICNRLGFTMYVGLKGKCNARTEKGKIKKGLLITFWLTFLFTDIHLILEHLTILISPIVEGYKLSCQ